MARRSVDDLPTPPDQFRIDLCEDWPEGKPRFETEDFSRAEDEERRKLVRSTARKSRSRRSRTAAESLANKLNYRLRDDAPATLASHLYMRDRRIRLIGAMWKLIAEGK